MSGDDPVLGKLREQVAAADLAILAAVNERIRLVTEIKLHKDARGLAFADPPREEWLLDYLAGANAGPLSPESLRELFGLILDLTKREVSGGEI